MRIPDDALTAPPTTVPTRTVVVPDWAELYETVKRRGWIVMDVPVEDLRKMSSGCEEAPPVKCLVSYISARKLPRVATRRLSDTRWFIAIKGESK